MQNFNRCIFRGKSVSDGDWVYGYLVKTKEHTYIALPDWYDDDLFYAPKNIFVEVISETVGQYTGCEDNQGEEIFEFDIVEEGCNGLINVVVWDKEAGTYKLKDFGEGYTIENAHIEWKIIGNLFDNPDLLEV